MLQESITVVYEKYTDATAFALHLIKYFNTRDIFNKWAQE